MTLRNFEAKWKKALTSILEELDESQFKKMLSYLEKIPQGVKAGKVREEMAQIIIQYYGAEESITVMNKAMDLIPRKDAAVQDLLRPFVDKLKNKQLKIKEEKKRKPATDSASVIKKEEPAAKKKSKPATGPASGNKKKEAPVCGQQSGQPDKKKKVPQKLKGSGQPAVKAKAEKQRKNGPVKPEEPSIPGIDQMLKLDDAFPGGQQSGQPDKKKKVPQKLKGSGQPAVKAKAEKQRKTGPVKPEEPSIFKINWMSPWDGGFDGSGIF